MLNNVSYHESAPELSKSFLRHLYVTGEVVPIQYFSVGVRPITYCYLFTVHFVCFVCFFAVTCPTDYTGSFPYSLPIPTVSGLTSPTFSYTVAGAVTLNNQITYPTYPIFQSIVVQVEAVDSINPSLRATCNFNVFLSHGKTMK